MIIDGVLVKKKMLDLSDEISLIKQSAEEQANHTIKKSKEDAEHCFNQAYIDGYKKGMLASLSQIALYFSHHDEYISESKNGLIKEIRGIVSSAMERPGVILSALDEYLQHHALSNNTLYIYLPQNTVMIESQLREKITDSWAGEINITYHSSNKFVLSCGQQIAEFSPDALVESTLALMFDKFNLIPTELQKISESALSSFLENCSEIYD